MSGSLLGLRERDHLADVLLAGEHRDEPVDAEREPRVRRRTEAERVEQEAEALLRLLLVDAEEREHPPLDVGAVDPHASRAQLPPVEHEVVRLRAHRERIGLEPVEVVGVRHRERVVRGDRAAVGVEPFEEREVDEPHEPQRPFADRRPAEVETHLPEHRPRRRALPRRDQHEIAGTRAERVDDAELLGLGEELHDR